MPLVLLEEPVDVVPRNDLECLRVPGVGLADRRDGDHGALACQIVEVVYRFSPLRDDAGRREIMVDRRVVA